MRRCDCFAWQTRRLRQWISYIITCFKLTECLRSIFRMQRTAQKETMSAMVAPSMAGLTVAYDSGSVEEDDDDIDDNDQFGDSEEPVSSDDYE